MSNFITNLLLIKDQNITMELNIYIHTDTNKLLYTVLLCIKEM